MVFKIHLFTSKNKQTNITLQAVHVFATFYIDDIVIFFKIFEKHLDHLQIVFATLNSKNVILKTIKNFLKYTSIILLKQLINLFDLTTTKKIKNIFKSVFYQHSKH